MTYNPTIMNDKLALFRKLPSIDELLRHPRMAELLKSRSHNAVTDSLRSAVDESREAISAGEDAPDADIIIDSALAHLAKVETPSLRYAINATGIIIHTGLGRAVLSEAAREAVDQVASGHSTLEIDVSTGKRGSRQEHIIDHLKAITGAESALVVNNNAAAVMLAINTLALDSEVIISRGQLVEIGGAFRMPDIITSSGARMREIGTTNRTRISDYQNAIHPQTGAVLRCHPSNYRIVGFTEEPALEDIVKVARACDIPVIDDLGSGAFIDVSSFGLEYEPTVQDSLKAGADIVSFSGDKLLGASQAGILVGKSEYISQCRSNPMARALRVDKLTLAALEATLRIYRYGDPIKDIPVYAAITRPPAEIDAQARRVAKQINSLGIDHLRAEVVETLSETGGGSLPGQSLQSRAVALKSSRYNAEDLGVHLRGCSPPIFGRIVKDTLFLDMRTVTLHEAKQIPACIRNL